MKNIFFGFVLVFYGFEAVLSCRGIGIALKPALSAASKVKVPFSPSSILTRVKPLSLVTRIKPLSSVSRVKPLSSVSKFKQPKYESQFLKSSIKYFRNSKFILPKIPRHLAHTPRYSFRMKVSDYSDISKMQLMFEEVNFLCYIFDIQRYF